MIKAYNPAIKGNIKFSLAFSGRLNSDYSSVKIVFLGKYLNKYLINSLTLGAT